MVVGAFSGQLPVIAASAIRLCYLRRTISSPNPSLDGASSAVATQWQLGYAITSSTISSLGPFLHLLSNSFQHELLTHEQRDWHPEWHAGIR